MAQKQIAVYLKPSAERQITAIAIYIGEKGSPQTAERFANRLYAFAESLATLPLKYPVCRHQILAKHNFRCALFNKSYVFVYKLLKDKLVVYHIIHASRLK